MNIILFLLSQCITLFGSTLVQMAIVWYVTMQTASGAWVAAFSVCSYLPQFLISFPGGAWADRYPRRLLIAGADGAAAAVTFLLLAAIPHLSSESLALGGFLLASALRSLGAGIQTPAVNAVIPQLAPEGQLMRYNGIHAALQSLVQFAAPAAAGLLLSVSTLESILWIDIFTALAGIGILSRIPLPQKKAIKEIPGRTAGENASVSSDIRTGVSYAFIHRQIGALLLLYGLFTFFCVPGGFLSGLYVRRRFGDSYWHLSAAELSGFLGMITGGLLVSIRGGNGRKCPARTLRSLLLLLGLSAAGMSTANTFLPYLVLMFFYGIFMTMIQTSITTLLQEKTEPFIQGRIFGLMGSMYAGFLPLGMAIFGPLSDRVSLNGLIFLSGAAYAALSAAVRKWMK